MTNLKDELDFQWLKFHFILIKKSKKIRMNGDNLKEGYSFSRRFKDKFLEIGIRLIYLRLLKYL